MKPPRNGEGSMNLSDGDMKKVWLFWGRKPQDSLQKAEQVIFFVSLSLTQAEPGSRPPGSSPADARNVVPPDEA
jgi:hypothetical protein